MKNFTTILILCLTIALSTQCNAQKKTLGKLYSCFEQKNVESYKQLFSDSNYLYSGRRISPIRRKETYNLKIQEIKTNCKDERCYSIFKLAYFDRYYHDKRDSCILLTLLKKYDGEWKIEEICENSNNKGELYLDKKINRNFTFDNLYNTYLSDSIAVSMAMEFEENRDLFEKKYRIFETHYYLQKERKDPNLNTNELELVMSETMSYYVSSLRRGFIRLFFKKDPQIIVCHLYFKINQEGAIEFYDTDGRRSENNLFK